MTQLLSLLSNTQLMNLFTDRRNAVCLLIADSSIYFASVAKSRLIKAAPRLVHDNFIIRRLTLFVRHTFNNTLETNKQ